MEHTSHTALERISVPSRESIDTSLIHTSPARVSPLQAALEYAERGWLVFPLWWPTESGCACGKSECANAGKHPITRRGVKSATKNEHTIRKWFTKWPNANVAIATGRASGLLVLDADDREQVRGSEALNDLFRQHEDVIETMIVRTGSGYHFYFLYPQAPVKNSVGRVTEGVDVRSDGGYVVAAPSRHSRGQYYRVLVEEPISELAGWLLDLATGDCSSPALTRHTTVPEGARNNELFRLACRLRGKEGMDSQDILRIAWSYNEAHCVPPLQRSEIVAIVESACRYPPERKTKKSLRRQNENPLWWMKFNVRHWFSDQNLNAMQDFQLGWYMRLLAFAWNKGGYLTVDPDELWRLARAKSKAVFEKNKHIVLSNFHEMDGPDGQPVLRDDALAHEYATTLEKWLKKISNGQQALKATSPGWDAVPLEND